MEAYYDVQSSLFIYYDGGAWIYRTHLPSQYRDYDLYYGYKVVMTDYRGDTPYTHFNEQKIKYAKGYRGKLQKTIGEKPGKEDANLDTLSKDYTIRKVSKSNFEIGANDNNIKKDSGNVVGNGEKK